MRTIITILILLAISCIILGNIYLPIWGWMIILAIIVRCLVSYIANTYEKEKNATSQRLSEIEALIREITPELRRQSKQTKNNFDTQIKSLTNLLNNHIKNINSTLGDLKSKDKEIVGLVNNTITKINNIENSIKQNSDSLSKEFLKECRDIRSFTEKHNNEILKNTKNSLSESTTEIKTTIENSTKKMLSEYEFKQTLDKANTKLGDIIKENTKLGDIIKENTENILGFVADLSSDIKSNNDELLKTILRIVNGESTSSNNSNETTLTKLKPNRTEEFFDEQSGYIVSNQYKDCELIKSTMKQSEQVVYDVEYKNNKIYRTQNYDTDGNVNIEQLFYDNGQVHYRKEYTKNGIIVTEFDVDGNKK